MAKQHWTELLPIHSYQVYAPSVLQDFDRTVVTALYQPLIGSGALSLYMTLWNELEKQDNWGKTTTHHTLMLAMDMPLKKIFHYRQKLEAVGLLKTFVTNKDNGRHFVYEMIPPMSPKNFFDDMILAVFLYHRLGKTKYNEVRSQFLFKSFEKENYQEVTSSFDDIFQSISPRDVKQVEEIEEEEEQIFQVTGESEGPQLVPDLFNFDLFYEGLADAIIPKEAITPEIKEVIIRLAFLYGVDHIEMKKVVMGSTALNSDSKIDEEVLRKKVREWYQFWHNNHLPAIIERTQPPQLQTMANKEPVTEEEKYVQYLEKTSPKEHFTNMSGGSTPTVTSLKIIEDIMFNQKLPAGVTNVLIDYVLKTQKMKFTRGFVETIASEWARKNIKTVTEAMNYAQEEQRKRKELQQGKTQKQTTSGRKPIRTEMIPDWAKEGHQPQADEITEEQREKFRRLKEELEK